MSFLFPRSVVVSRPAVPVELGAGLQPAYSGELPTSEIPVAGPFAAAVQMKKTNGKPAGDLPGDAAQKTFWLVMIQHLPLGEVNVRDIITDDLGNRYQVLSDYTTPMAGNFLCERLDI